MSEVYKNSCACRGAEIQPRALCSLGLHIYSSLRLEGTPQDRDDEVAEYESSIEGRPQLVFTPQPVSTIFARCSVIYFAILRYRV